MNENLNPEDGFVVITPMHRTMNAGTAYCIELAHRKGLPFLWMPHPGDALIGRARSITATWVLEKSPFNYAIFLDSDIVFQPEDLTKLWLDMKEKKYNLIGGVYTVRSAQQLAHYGYGGKIRVDGNIHEIEYLSTGFMGFTKNLLQGIVDKCQLPVCHANHTFFRCYPFFENTAVEHNGEWIYESEDWDFCRKARKAGFKPYLDTSIRLGHEGNKVWGISDMPADVKHDDVSLGKIHLPKAAARREPNSRLVLLK